MRRPAVLDQDRDDGPAFLLRGLGGLAVTARNVADALGDAPAGMFVDDPEGTPRWYPIPVEVVDRHPVRRPCGE